MRISNFLTGGLILAIVAAGYLGYRYEKPALIWAAVTFGGVVMGIASIEPILSGRLVERDPDTNRVERRYVGLSARLRGLSGLMLGGAVVLLGVVQMLGLGQAVLQHLQARPGAALLAGGAFFALASLPYLIGAREDSHAYSRWNFWVSIPGRLIALLFLVLALGVILVGLLEMAAPAEFDRLWVAWLGLPEW